MFVDNQQGGRQEQHELMDQEEEGDQVDQGQQQEEWASDLSQASHTSQASQTSPSESQSISTTSKSKSKRQKIMADLTPDEERIMTEWLEDNPVLYNKKKAGYKNRGAKELLWREQADRLGKTVEMLKVWYKSLRTRFGRLIKPRSGQADPKAFSTTRRPLESL
jgi:hypothetical protein